MQTRKQDRSVTAIEDSDKSDDCDDDETAKFSVSRMCRHSNWSRAKRPLRSDILTLK